MGRQVSNLQPSGPKPDALPIELRPRIILCWKRHPESNRVPMGHQICNLPRYHPVLALIVKRQEAVADGSGFEPERPFRAWPLSRGLISATHPPVLSLALPMR